MSPPNASHGPVKQSNGSRPAPARIVPAIPLALTKRQPKPAAAKPKSQVNSTALGDEADKCSDKKDAVAVEKSHEQEDNAPTPTMPKSDVISANSQADLAHMPAFAKDVSANVATVPTESTTDAATTGLDEPTGYQTEQSYTRSLHNPSATSTATETFSSTANPAERLEMRQLKTELPPAFVPNAEQPAPPSATSSSFRQAPLSISPSHHMYHSSSNGIVFGADDSINSSPAPSDFQRSQPQTTHIPQQHDAPVLQPNMPPGLGYRNEPATFAPPPQTNGTKTPPYNIRRDIHSAYYQPNYVSPQRPANFRYPPREPFTPSGSHTTNGASHAQVSHTASPSSSTNSAVLNHQQNFQNPVVADGAGNLIRQTPTAQGAPGPDPSFFHQQQPQAMHHFQTTAPPNDRFLQTENAQSLRDHILYHYATPQLSDCHLHITEEATGVLRHLDAHKIVISRSPTLRGLVYSAPLPPGAGAFKTQIHVALQGRFQSAEALKESVRFLYGGPLLQMPLVSPLEPGNHERVETALRYLATGAYLQADQIAQRGMEITLALLYWDTLPNAVAYAFEHGISTFWQNQGGVEQLKDRNDFLRQPEWTEESISNIYQVQFQQRLLDWIIHYFPTDFYLDTSQSQMEILPRLPSLPATHQRKNSQADPRLSKIRFGDMEADNLARPHIGITALSSLLLSLPFPVLKGLLEHWVLAQRLGFETVASIMRSVVNEREKRRKQALLAWIADSAVDHTAKTNAVQTMHWEENVVISDQTRSGCRLVRRNISMELSPEHGPSDQGTMQ
ncbi:hypothetical protein MBLNU230_g2075t1 [Neophaeotheca triangularis]